jgi:hypothetical protein
MIALPPPAVDPVFSEWVRGLVRAELDRLLGFDSDYLQALRDAHEDCTCPGICFRHIDAAVVGCPPA